VTYEMKHLCCTAKVDTNNLAGSSLSDRML